MSIAEPPQNSKIEPQQEESPFEAPLIGEQERMIEAILFASADPVTVKDLESRMPHGCDGLRRWRVCVNAIPDAGCMWCELGALGSFARRLICHF